MKLSIYILLTTLVCIALSVTKCVMDTREYVEETRFTITNSMSNQEQSYRACLKRTSSWMGVTDRNKMTACSKEVGFYEN
jgi:hypothetical protein